MGEKSIQELVKVLTEGLMPFVYEGLITKEKAEARARNQACILLGLFEITLIEDGTDESNEENEEIRAE